MNGNGLEIDSSKIHLAMKIGARFTPDKFRYMCIVAGCDYLPSLPGIGLGKARKLFQIVTNTNLSEVSKQSMNIFMNRSTVGQLDMFRTGIYLRRVAAGSRAHH